jgi:hypothetical protein
MAENTEKQTAEEAWREVGSQFQTLGDSLAQAFRTAWGSEENRRHVQNMKDGLEAMVDKVGQAISEASASPEAKRFRGEAEKAAESLRAAGEQTWQDARPHLLSALSQVNAELQKMIGRMEAEEPAPEAAPEKGKDQ